MVVRLSALNNGRLYPAGKLPGTHFCKSTAPGHSATGRIKSLNNSSDSIGNQTSDLPACSAVPPRNHEDSSILGSRVV
jgi:hypothetical protein